MTTKRTFSLATQLATIYRTDLGRLGRARKTLVLGAVQLLPVLFALVYVFFDDIDGLAVFSKTVERVMFPFLIPLAAIFYGGPALVDEMEGRTLTYLTLRPVPKPLLFIGKWLAGTTLAVALVMIPIVSLLVIVMIAAGGTGATSFASIGQILLASALGTAAYTAIFACLGAIAAKSLFPGIVYFVVFELLFPLFPILELLSVRFHMRNAAGFNAADRLGVLDKLIFDEPLHIAWWVGVLLLAGACSAALAAGAAAFSTKQYHIK